VSANLWISNFTKEFFRFSCVDFFSDEMAENQAFQFETSAILEAVLKTDLAVAAEEIQVHGSKASMNQLVREESQRIFRLCLHKKLAISSSAVHERAFCICLSMALKLPNLWSSMMLRLGRKATWRIPQVGEIHLGELKKFMSVASAVLSLKLNNLPTQPKLSSREVVAKAHDNEGNIATVNESTCAPHASSSITTSSDGLLRVADVQEDLECTDAANASRSEFLRGAVNWRSIADRTQALFTRFPQCFMPLKATVEEDVVCLVCGLQAPTPFKRPPADDSEEEDPVQGVPRRTVHASSHSETLLQCALCHRGVHQECIFPPQHDVCRPFRCHDCRLGFRKRPHDEEDANGSNTRLIDITDPCSIAARFVWIRRLELS
jgi:hypothetical protein